MLKQKKYERNNSLYLENQLTAKIKQDKKRKIEEEELRIEMYNIAKAKKEQEDIQKLKMIHDEKERENQRLREKQMRTTDKKADIDALYAKRAFEAKDRQERERERKQWEQKIKMEYEVHSERKM